MVKISDVMLIQMRICLSPKLPFLNLKRKKEKKKPLKITLLPLLSHTRRVSNCELTFPSSLNAALAHSILGH